MAPLRNVAAAATISVCSMGVSAADFQYGFANVYADYLNWSNGFKDLSKSHVASSGYDVGHRGEHYTIGIEAGAGFSWGELYGFYEYEKINWASDERDQALKASVHYRIAGSDVTLYGQVYDINDNKFNNAEQNRVVGLGYLGLQGNGWWFKPWIGVHDVSFDGNGSQLAENGFNGGMLGWSAGCSFEIAGQSLMVTNWNEIEFARNSGFKKFQYNNNGLNGAIGLWYDINETFYIGAQYRYFRNKLGWEGYGDAMIYRIGMHL